MTHPSDLNYVYPVGCCLLGLTAVLVVDCVNILASLLFCLSPSIVSLSFVPAKLMGEVYTYLVHDDSGTVL